MMPDNSIQVTLEIDIKALQSGLQQGKDQVDQQTKEMADAFEDLSKRSKSAIEDMQKAAKLAGFDISDAMKSALEEIPKLAKGIAEAFTSGNILGLVGVLLDAGIAIKGLIDEVILLKGAKEEWNEVNKKLSDSEEALDAKIRKNTIEHIRLTQGEAAAAHASLEMADKDIVNIGKDMEQILAGKKSGELSDGLKRDLEGLKHFNFGELPQKITDVQAAIGRAEKNVQDLTKDVDDASQASAEAGSEFAALGPSIQLDKATGELQVLKHLLETLNKAQQEHDQSKDNQSARAGQLDDAEAERKRRKQQELLQQDIALQNAGLDANKRVADAEIQQDEQAARTILQHHQRSAEEEMAIETRLEEEKNQAQEKYLQDKLKQLERDRGQNKQQIIAVHGEIEALHVQHQTRLNQIHDDYQQRLDKDAQQALRDEVKRVEDKVAQTKAGSQERVRILEDELAKLTAEHKTETEEFKRLEKEKGQAVRELEKELEAARQERVRSEQQHEQALEGLQRSRLDFERQIGKLSEGEYEARLKVQLDADFAHEKKELEIERDRYQKGTKEYEKYQAGIVKLTDKHNAEIEKLEQKSYQRRRQEFDQYFKQISSGFNTALNSWMQGTETASQAFGKMFQDIMSQLINFVEQWIEKKIEMWLMDKLLSHTSQSAAAIAQITSNAAVAASGAYAATAAIPFVGPELAPEAAMVAYMDVMSMAPAAFALGGIVPATGLALVHQGERVLPASMSGTGDFGGPAVHVHLNVNAIDSHSFQGTIKRHGNMIGNEVLRVLKKRGIASR